jgi:hypothetical protein
MKLNVNRIFAAAVLGLGLALQAGPAPQAADVDFSCLSYEARGKARVAERYKEYDVVLENRCPGPVYWAMCIERVDPKSHRVVETHTPAGYLEADKTSRVNMQLKKGPENMTFRKRFQEFYVSTGYAIDAMPAAACAAQKCEAPRRELRQRIDANLAAWAEAQQTLETRLVDECPESGWGATEDLDTCREPIRAAGQEQLQQHAQTDQALREELQSAEPAGCQIFGGDLVEP